MHLYPLTNSRSVGFSPTLPAPPRLPSPHLRVTSTGERDRAGLVTARGRALCDPLFVDKVRDIVGLYLWPPRGAVVNTNPVIRNERV